MAAASGLYHADNLDCKYGGGIWSYNAETNVIYCATGGPVLRKQLSGTPPGPAAAGSSGTPPTSMAPTIQTQPTSQSVNAGQTATFSVSASGTPSPSYQWQRNGANIVGATAASYTTPATVIGDHGVAFRVIVSNSAGAVTSSAATLTVTDTATAPTITTQPVAASVTTGQTATFTVAASGTGPLTYQWQRNGANLSGATAASYTTSATVLADSGASFRVIVTNGIGSETSNVVTLTVTDAATGGGTAGLLGRYYPSINFTGTPVERVDAQINFNWSPVGHGGTGSPGISGVGPERFTVRWTGTLTATTSGPYTFVVICDDGARLSLNGTVVIDAWSGPLWTKVKTTTPVTLTAGVPVAIQLDYLQGDGGARIELQWAPGSSDWDSATIPAANLSAATSSVPVVIAPAISAQPVSAAIIVGQVATFSVTAIGTAALSYQWQRQGTNIDGANGSSYTTPTAVLADDGALFRVVVSNTAGSVTSSAATLRVTAGTPPPDTTPPATPPAPTVAGNGSTTPTLSGTTESGATLTIRADGVVIGVAQANGAGQWSFPASGLPAGSHIITVTATDAAGNASAASPSLTITVGDGAPPTGGDSSTPPTSNNAGSSGGAGCGMGGGLAGIGLLLVGASWLRRLA